LYIAAPPAVPYHHDDASERSVEVASPMAVLRLSNGSDVTVELDVEETLAAVNLTKGTSDFVELPGKDGPIHIRPSSVIAVLEDVDRKTTGFRAAAGGG
jgi:hypothetical protein